MCSLSLIDNLIREGILDEATAARFSRRGHVVYESGDHGDTWLDLDLLFADPRRVQSAAVRLAEKVRSHVPDIICGPLAGGALIGQWVAGHLGLAFVCAERLPTHEGVTYEIATGLRSLVLGKRVVIVDDAINAGAATLACAREIERFGGVAVAAAALIVRQSAGRGSLWPVGLPLESLAVVQWNTWPADVCPLCRSGIPVDQFG